MLEIACDLIDRIGGGFNDGDIIMLATEFVEEYCK